MTDDLTREAELKRIAEAAEPEWFFDLPTRNLRAFHAAANPTEILRLLAENQRLRDQRDAALALHLDERYVTFDRRTEVEGIGNGCLTCESEGACATRAALTGELAARERKERGNK